MREVTRIAYRGLAGLYPENTLLSFEKSLDYRPDAIELDVQLSADGGVVIHHDEEFGRTTDAKGYVKDFTLPELKRFSASYTRPDLPRQEIPTLCEYFDLIAGNPVKTFVELKNSFVPYPGLEEKVLEILDRYGRRETSLVYSANHYSVMKFREMAPDVAVVFSFDNWIFGYGEYCEKHGVAMSIPYHLAMTKELIDDFHAHGVRVYPWTVDTEEDMDRIFGMGADGVLTNRIDVLNAYLGL